MSSADDVRACIADGHEERKGKTLCGRDVVDFVFQSVDHWFLNRRQSGRLQGCPHCLAEVERALVLERGGVVVGAYGPVLVRSDDDEPSTIGFYDNDELCDECASLVAVVLQRDGSVLYSKFELLEPCSDDVWEAAGFDPTASLLGADQSPPKGSAS